MPALGYAKMGDLGHALAALVPLSSDVPLIGIYNNAGAVAVQASREEKKEDERGAFAGPGHFFSGARRRVVARRSAGSLQLCAGVVSFGQIRGGG